MTLAEWLKEHNYTETPLWATSNKGQGVRKAIQQFASYWWNHPEDIEFVLVTENVPTGFGVFFKAEGALYCIAQAITADKIYRVYRYDKV